MYINAIDYDALFCFVSNYIVCLTIVFYDCTIAMDIHLERMLRKYKIFYKIFLNCSK